MFSRQKIIKFIFYYCIICVIVFIVFAIGVATSSSRQLDVSVKDEEKYFVDRMSLKKVQKEEKYLKESKTVVEAMCHDFPYPVKTRLELTNLGLIRSSADSIAARFRRDNKQTLSQNSDSVKDYMSIYYAQRKEIMEKYKAQQKEIMERLKQTKNLIAETKKLRLSKKIDSVVNNGMPDTRQNITSKATSKDIDFKTTMKSVGLGTVNSSKISNDTQNTDVNIFNTANKTANVYWLDIDPPKPSLASEINETVRVNEKIEIIDKPDVKILNANWPSESINLIPHNEVDLNSTEKNFISEERENETVIFNIGNHLDNLLKKNDSALNQLEEMFLWDVPAGDERIPRSNESGATTRQINDDSTIGNSNIIGRLENLNQSSDSLRFMVEIKSSPDVHVTKNVKNIQSSTTTYRNSTHEIVEINGIVNSTKLINDSVLSNVDLPYSNNVNLSNHESSSLGGSEIVGQGATESEWCEECPHDYTWGNCTGTLFYQHNIFLRNRGPSAVDAIFGMNVQGPVKITCVEAIRFNQTRGIVTLHSGGENHDFAKLRIRGFQGEGFSYIMKVWGVTIDEEFIDDSLVS